MSFTSLAPNSILQYISNKPNRSPPQEKQHNQGRVSHKLQMTWSLHPNSQDDSISSSFLIISISSDKPTTHSVVIYCLLFCSHIFVLLSTPRSWSLRWVSFILTCCVLSTRLSILVPFLFCMPKLPSILHHGLNNVLLPVDLLMDSVNPSLLPNPDSHRIMLWDSFCCPPSHYLMNPMN